MIINWTDKPLHLIPRDLTASMVIDVSIAILATTICSTGFFPTRWNPTNDVDCKRIIPLVWESLGLEVKYITDVHVRMINRRRIVHVNTRMYGFYRSAFPKSNLQELLDNLARPRARNSYKISWKDLDFIELYRKCCVWKRSPCRERGGGKKPLDSQEWFEMKVVETAHLQKACENGARNLELIYIGPSIDPSQKFHFAHVRATQHANRCSLPKHGKTGDRSAIGYEVARVDLLQALNSPGDARCPVKARISGTRVIDRCDFTVTRETRGI